MQLITDISILTTNTAPLNMSDGLCKTVMYLSLEMSSIPGWILVAFSVDKTLSMRKKPIVILKKKSFQWSVVAAIVLANLILYIEIPITLHLKSYSSIQNILYCDLATLDYFKPFIIINLLETTIIPFGIMVISSMITIRLLYKSRRSLEISGRLSVQRRSKDVKFAISSLTFCFLYVSLKMPNLVFYIMYANRETVSYYFLTISYFLFLVNSSATFFVNFVSNSIFRREFYILFRINLLIDELTSNTGRSNALLDNRILPILQGI